MTNKLTKLIATIGPSTDSEELIEFLIQHGVDIIRFNFKHSTPDWHKERVERVKRVAATLNPSLGTLLDLQGPEIRLTMPFDQIELQVDEKIVLSESIFETKEKGFSLSDTSIINLLSHEQKILAEDGLFEFIVEKENDKVFLISKSEGTLKNNKSINIIGFNHEFPVIHEKDRVGLHLAKEEEVDFVALSFVRSAEDIKILRKEMEDIGLNAKIVAKIETAKALTNIDEIIEETDLVMIARGDLGVEIPAEEVPFYQKSIIRKCMEKGVPVITATQMLETMIQKPLPTRAEVSDVANAVYDFTDAVMLSGETASGEYPKEAVRTIKKVTSFIEEKNRVEDIRSVCKYDLSLKSQMIADSAFNLYKVFKNNNESIHGFITFTQSGSTARMISRYRTHVKVFAFCPSQSVARSLSASFGVFPITQKSLKEKTEIVKEDIQNALKHLKENNLIEEGQNFIILHGDYWKSDEGTSTIRIVSS